MTNALALHTLDNEQRILDTDLAEALGYSIPREVRQHLIEANRQELETLGTLRTHLVQSGGRPATAYYLNEEQALLVCMFSRTVNAQAVRKQVIDTFMAVRRGQLQPAIPNFTDPAEAAIAWATEYKAKQIAQQRVAEVEAVVAEMKPLPSIGARAASHDHSLSRFVRTLPCVNTMRIKAEEFA